MNTKTKLTALVTTTFIALASTVTNAASMSDGVFSWPTDYKTQTVSEAVSTFDGNVQKLQIQKKDEAKKAKRK